MGEIVTYMGNIGCQTTVFMHSTNWILYGLLNKEFRNESNLMWNKILSKLKIMPVDKAVSAQAVYTSNANRVQINVLRNHFNK